jgi:hypothetical protein
MFLTLCPDDHEQGEHAPASALQRLQVPVLCTPVLGPSGPMGSLAAQQGPADTPVCVKGEGRDTGWQGEVVQQVLKYVCTQVLQP